ncbi:MAG: flagellar biosynthesis anti-sigma factor FlgM, partial [Pseudomonadota bacterium]
SAGPTGRASYTAPRGPDRAAPSSGGASGLAAPAPRTEVSLTEDAALLQALDAQIAATPTVDAGRVEEIRTALASGEYRLDPERVAERLLAAEGGIRSLLFRN